MREHELNDPNPNRLLRDAYRRPESLSVGKPELGQLSLRSMVAIALRCVRRVRPVFRPVVDDKYGSMSCRFLDDALDVALIFAAGGDLSKVRIREIAETAVKISHRAIPGAEVAHAAAEIASAVEAALSNKPDDTMNHAVTAVFMALSCAPISDEESRSEMEKIITGAYLDQGPDAMRDPLANDFETTLTLDLEDFPAMGKPLDPREGGPLGPLWPEGPPAWWTATRRPANLNRPSHSLDRHRSQEHRSEAHRCDG